MSLRSKNFNLLVSTGRMQERRCCREIEYLLIEVGDEKPKAKPTGIPGLIVVKTTLNPFEAVKRLRELFKKRPWDFRYTLKVTPIEVTVDTDFDKIVTESVKLAQSKIKEEETYRVTVNRRYTTIDKSRLIDAIASRIKRKVNLTSPDKIINIEILGKVTGISVLKPEDILSIAKLKRELGFYGI